MQTQLLPADTCEDIDKSNRDYWWNGDIDKDVSMHFIPWNTFICKKNQGGMGLRKARLQNLALLGKLCWRLLSEEDSPCLLALKQRYFKNISFLEAKKNSRGTSFWNSLVAVKNIFQHELCWSLGGNKRLRIWDDAWIPSQIYKKPFGPRPLLGPTFVDELFSWADRQWNVTLLESLFSQTLIEEILKIRIPSQSFVANIYWVHEKNGILTAKSAYHWLVSSSIPLNTNGLGKSIWSKIWKLHVPERIKLHFWRMIHNGLPTKENLFRRKSGEDNLCPRCGIHVETVMHAFFECREVKMIWFASPFGFRFDINSSFTLIQLISMLYGGLSKSAFLDSCSLLASIAYMIWIHRNALIFENCSPIMDVDQTLKMAANSLLHNNPLSHQEPFLPITIHGPPTTDLFILIVDGSYDTNNHSNINSGLGFVLLNFYQEIMFAGKKGCYTSSVEESESLGVLWSITNCSNKGVQSLIVCGDNANVLNTFSTSGSNTNMDASLHTRMIVHDTLPVLGNFDYCKFVKLPRNLVQPAHVLATEARLAHQDAELLFDKDCIPSNISEVVCNMAKELYACFVTF